MKAARCAIVPLVAALVLASVPVVAEAKSVQVAYDYERGEPVPLPERWRERLGAVAA